MAPHVHTVAHADIARTPCLASQPETVDTFKKSESRAPSGGCGEVSSADRVTEVDALGKHFVAGDVASCHAQPGRMA